MSLERCEIDLTAEHLNVSSERILYAYLSRIPQTLLPKYKIITKPMFSTFTDTITTKIL